MCDIKVFEDIRKDSMRTKIIVDIDIWILRPKSRYVIFRKYSMMKILNFQQNIESKDKKIAVCSCSPVSETNCCELTVKVYRSNIEGPPAMSAFGAMIDT